MTFVYTTNLSEVRVLAETQARSAGLAEDRVVDFVIADPTEAGRQPPAADASGGHGLWLVHQICDKVELRSDAGGTTIRLHMSLSPPGRGARDSPDSNGATTTPDVA